MEIKAGMILVDNLSANIFLPLSGRAQISESNAEKPRDGLSGSTIYDVYLSQSGEQSEKGLYRDGN